MTTFETLGLSHVLADTLPTTLGTPEAPATYQVDAIFNRRPRPGELTHLHSDATIDVLASAGYPSVRLAASDRRLEITGSNLEELAAGLSTTIADRLGDLSVQLEAKRSDAADAAVVEAASMAERAAAVVKRANAVTFERSSR